MIANQKPPFAFHCGLVPHSSFLKRSDVRNHQPSKPFVFSELWTLCRSAGSQLSQNQQLPDSFCKMPGVGYRCNSTQQNQRLQDSRDAKMRLCIPGRLTGCAGIPTLTRPRLLTPVFV